MVNKTLLVKSVNTSPKVIFCCPKKGLKFGGLESCYLIGRPEIYKSYLIDSTSEVQFIFVLNEPFRRPNERPKSVPESVLDFRTLVRSLISFKLSLTQFKNFQVHKSTDFGPSLTGFCFNLHLPRRPTCFNWVKIFENFKFSRKIYTWVFVRVCSGLNSFEKGLKLEMITEEDFKIR